MAHRTRIGRQKIEIRRIKSQEARLVCFSKRRAGLFNKANELAILCGVEVAAIVFSPGKKAFSFGYPSVEAVLERFDLTRLALGAGGGGSGEENKLLADLNRQYEELSEKLDAAKAKNERLDEAMEKQRAAASHVAGLLEADVHDMGKRELIGKAILTEPVTTGVSSTNQLAPAPRLCPNLRAETNGGYRSSSYRLREKSRVRELMECAATLQVVKAVVTAHANQVLQDNINREHAMAAKAMARSSNKNQVQPPQQQFLTLGTADNGWFNFGGNISHSAINNGAEIEMQIQQMLQDTLNRGRAMAAKAMACSSNKYQVQPPQQQFLTLGTGDNGWFNFGGNISNTAINNGADMEMQIQQMIMGMTLPPPGFAGASMEMLLQQGVGFPGPY